jgi:hypothetical protein
MKKLIGIVMLCAAALLAIGCADNTFDGTEKENQPPQVWLSSAPPEGSTAEYTLHLFWGGWDPDGELAYYEWVVTNNVGGVFDPADTTGADKWRRVYSNDSTFTFTADVLADSSEAHSELLKPVDFVRTHTFFIRAVDDRGLASVKPAYRSFTSRTLSPVVDILVPRRVAYNPAEVAPITTFSWTARDYISNERQVQEPDSVRWILVSTNVFNGSWTATADYIRTHPHAPEWSNWRYYRAPGDSGKSWTTRPLDFGAYMFGVQVKDEAGAVCPVFDEDRNLRRVAVTPRLTGPRLTVYNRYLGSIVTSSPNSPVTIIDMPAGVPMSFRFSADASSYGGVVSGYRYGWDIQDFKDESQWEISYTPFVTYNNGVPSASSPQRTWRFDSHTFYIEVIDNSGYTSRAGITVNIVPFTFRKNLVFIDDYHEASSAGFQGTNGGSPSDEEHDAFWDDMLGDVSGFDPSTDVIEVKDELPIQWIADYKSMVWDTYAGYNLRPGVSLLPEIVRFIPSDPSLGGQVSGKVKPNVVALYMAAGGHVLLCGEQPMTAVINQGLLGSPSFPLIFRYELAGDQKAPYEDSVVGESGVGDNSFAYNECCLNVLDISAISNVKLIRNAKANTCPVKTIRDHSVLTDGLRSAIPLDEASGFPLLELRPEVADPGKTFAPDKRGLVNDIYNPPYFDQVCGNYTETNPPRPCIQPIYAHGCLNASSKIYGAPIAFWTLTFADRIPDSGGGVAAKSAVWGFEPVFFKPEQVKTALDLILFDEWKLPRE